MTPTNPTPFTRAGILLAALLICTSLTGQDRLSGTWREGYDHKLWIDATWGDFSRKDGEFAAQNYRLTDIEVADGDGGASFYGIWMPGSGAHQVASALDWPALSSRWDTAKRTGLRLVDVEVYDTGGTASFAAVWREGDFEHKLLVDASEDDLTARDEEFTGKGFYLVDVETYLFGAERLYLALWHQGGRRTLLKQNLSWPQFDALRKSSEKDGLVLVDLETWMEGGQRRYIGLWHEGTSRQELFIDAPEKDFLETWRRFRDEGLVINDIEIPDNSGGALPGGAAPPIATNDPPATVQPTATEPIDQDQLRGTPPGGRKKDSGGPADGNGSGSSSETGGEATTGFVEEGKASYYHSSLEGNKTASGEPYEGKAFTAAHRTLPFNTRLRVTNLANGKTVTVRVNDRGPYAKSRIIDLSEAAAEALDAIQAGVITVRIEELK